jgi:hypothetical protein
LIDRNNTDTRTLILKLILTGPVSQFTLKLGGAGYTDIQVRWVVDNLAYYPGNTTWYSYNTSSADGGCGLGNINKNPVIAIPTSQSDKYGKTFRSSGSIYINISNTDPIKLSDISIE